MSKCVSITPDCTPFRRGRNVPRHTGLAFLVLAVSSCDQSDSYKNVCVTECGLVYQGMYPTREQGWDCDTLQLAEKRLLSVAVIAGDERISDLEAFCQAMRGWSLWLYPRRSWTDAWGREVSGVTIYSRIWVQVGWDAEYSIYESAYAHEMLHVGQNTWARPDGGTNQVDGHENWIDAKLYSVIDAFISFKGK